MSRWRRERLSLGLDAATLAGPGAACVVAEQATPEAWTAPRLRDAIRAQMQPTMKYASAHVLMGADVCRHFVQDPPAGLRSLAELRALSAARASRIYGGKPVEWSVVADWNLARPFVCAAVPSGLLQALRQAAAELGLSLTVESAVLTALERVMPVAPDEGFVAWTTPGGAVLAHLALGGVTTLRCLRLPAGLPAEGLVELMAREVMQEGLRAGLRADTLRVARAGSEAEAHCTWGPVQVQGFDAGAALPAWAASDTEAGWASRLAALASKGA